MTGEERPVYLDHHSTTPVDPGVLDAMLPFFTRAFGNASSRDHRLGHEATVAVDRAREQLALLLGCSADDIVFTSGATESNNLALLGAAEQYRERGRHIISVQTEHPSVLDPLRHLEDSGFEITFLGVDNEGRVDPHRVAAALRPDTILVSVMAANNEIGTLAPLSVIAGATREAGVLFHTDATQAVGHIPISIEGLGLDLVSLSAHKFYGPKGVGALYVRSRNPRVKLQARQFGGGQESGWRSGTLNVPGIVGLGAAAEIAAKRLEAEGERLRSLRDRLLDRLRSDFDDLRLHGHPRERLPHNLAFGIPGVKAKSLVVNLPDLAFSTGAACASAKAQPSHVLSAIGLTPEQVREGVRIGLGRTTTEEDVDYAATRLIAAARKLRRLRGSAVT